MTEAQYLETIDRHAKNSINFAFQNKRLDYAAIIMSKILEYADKEVRIYDNTINGDIADRHPLFNKTLVEFLESGKTFKLVIKNEEYKNSTIYESLAEFSKVYPTQVIVKLATDDFKEVVKKNVASDANFMVNDKNALRLEISADNRDAICNFNDKQLATQLCTIFDQKFDSCSVKILPLPEYEHS